MDPYSYYNNLISHIKNGHADIEIHSNGKISECPSEKKDGSKRAHDHLVLSVAIKLLNEGPLTGEESLRKSLAKKVIKKLTVDIGNDEVKRVLLQILKASQTQNEGSRLVRSHSQLLTSEFRSKLESKSVLKRKPSLPKVFDLVQLQKGSGRSANSSSSEGSNEEASASSSASPISPRVQDHLKLSEIYPSQHRVVKSERFRSNSKKYKTLAKKVESYLFLGPKAFETKARAPMTAVLNHVKVPHQIGLDIFRYLSRNGISFSTSESGEDLLASKSSSEEEHAMIAERVVKLLHLLITSLPDQCFKNCEVPASEIQSRREKHIKLVQSEFSGLNDSTDVQNKIQEFIEKCRQDNAHQELSFLAKILQGLAQDAPNHIATFIMNTGAMHNIDLERLPIEISMHFEKSTHQLFVIYKTYLKDRDMNKRSQTGDPIRYLLNSKMVFSILLNNSGSDWVFEKQSLHLGLPENHKKSAADTIKPLFNTFLVLGLEPEICVCPSTVPEKLSRI